jgi:hypothetical protein
MTDGDRAAAEATVILGRAAVNTARGNRATVEGFIWDHPSEVRLALAEIRAYLPDDISSAVEYAAALAPELRAALAGAWMDGAAGRVIQAQGIEEGDV